MGYNNPVFGGLFKLLANSCSVQPEGSFGKPIQNKIENAFLPQIVFPQGQPGPAPTERDGRGAVRTRQSEKNDTVCRAPAPAMCAEAKEIPSRVWKRRSSERPDRRL